MRYCSAIVKISVSVALALLGLVTWTGIASRSVNGPIPPGASSSASSSLGETQRKPAGATPASDPAARARVIEAYAKLPVSFELNQGQADPSVKFLSRGGAYSLFLTSTESVLVLNGSSPKSHSSSNNDAAVARARRATLRLKLAGGNAGVQVEGVDEQPGKTSYFIGKDSGSWRTGIPSYARVKYRNVYPGIDVIYHGNQQRMEFDYVVAAGADYKDIHLAVDGARRTRLEANGDLVFTTAVGEVRQHKPFVYQEVDGARLAINARYVLDGTHQVGFDIGEYDAGKPLVIDPVLDYSTFLGGTSSDEGRSIVLDGSGNAYITGRTTSFNFPITIDGFDTTYANSFDVFVTKLNAAGSALVYSTYLGGTSDDSGFGVVVDSAGSAYVTGSTSSSTYPTTPGAFQTTPRGGSDGFVTKLNDTGTALVYSTYLGGTSSDQASAIALDSSSNAYVTGFSVSSNFPTTVGAFQTINAGGSFIGDAFVAKLNGTGTALTYSTFLGGARADQGTGIVVDSSGRAFVVGATNSIDFDVTTGAFQTIFGGSSSTSNVTGDAFVTELNDTGTALVYSTYLGGSGDDGGLGIGLNSSGEAFVCGLTTSFNLPVTPGVVRVANGGVARSGNAAASWEAGNNGITDGTVLAFVVNPLTTSTLYAGTNASGVFRTTDSGAHWAAANAGLTNLTIKALAIDPSIPAILYLGTSGRGVFKSTDAGDTWRGVNTGQGGSTVNAVLVDPSNTSVLYAGTDNGPFKSTDGGANWTAIRTGLNSLFIQSMAIDPVNTSNLYLSSFGGVYISRNGGQNWALGLSSPGTLRAVRVDPLAPAIVYVAGDGGILKSTDSGLTWRGANTGLSNRTVNAVAVNPMTSSIVYAGTAGGMFKSTDGGGIWSSANTGLAGAVLNAIAVDPATPATLFAGAASGATDGFAARLNAAGSALDYSTYLGGVNFDTSNSLAVDSANNVFLTGQTSSSNFPTTPGVFQSIAGFNSDAYVTKLSATGAVLVYSTFLGGQSTEQGFGIAVDSSGSAYVTGTTSSNNFPITPGAFQTLMGGVPNNFSDDAFVAKLNPTPSLTADMRINMTGPVGPVGGGSSVVYSITITNDGPDPAYSLLITDELPASLTFSFCSSSTISCNTIGNAVTFSVTSLGAGESVQATIFTNANCSLPDGGTITNTARVESLTPDPNGGNNVAMVSNSTLNPPPTISPLGQSFPMGGGSNVVNVSSFSSCSWSAVSNADWITINFSSGCCNGSVFYGVAANPGVFRSGTMTIAGQTFLVTQQGVICAFTLDSTGQGFGSNGGTGSVTVTGPDACNWTAVSDSSWLTITSGASGTGIGAVNYSVAPNPDVTSRSGTINAAGNILTVNQAGLAAVGLSYFKPDLDSDGKADIAFYRAGLWGWLKSLQSYSFSSPQFFSWGGPGLQPICADFDGDGKADIGYVAPPAGGQSAVYSILKSSTGYSFTPGLVLFVPAGFPSLGDIPVVGDVDGDGKADPGIWRSSQGVWMIPKSSSNYTSFIFTQWGQQGDVPVIADIDGDGKADIGYYRDGLWAFLKSTQNYSYCCSQFFSWGGPGVQPIIGDFDGDAKIDLGYIAPPAGGQSAAYAILKSSTNYDFTQAQFATAGFPSVGDTPVVADYDADGKADPGIWRETAGVWIVPKSSTGYTSYVFTQWGQSGDIVIPNSTGKR